MTMKPDTANPTLKTHPLHPGRLSPHWRLKLAQAYAANGEIPKAEEHVRIAYAANPMLKDGYAQIAWQCHWPAKRFAEFIALCRLDERLKRLSPKWRCVLAEALARSGRTREAVETADQTYHEFPELRESFARMGWLYHRHVNASKPAWSLMLQFYKSGALWAEWLLSAVAKDESASSAPSAIARESKAYIRENLPMTLNLLINAVNANDRATYDDLLTRYHPNFFLKHPNYLFDSLKTFGGKGILTSLSDVISKMKLGDLSNDKDIWFFFCVSMWAGLPEKAKNVLENHHFSPPTSFLGEFGWIAYHMFIGELEKAETAFIEFRRKHPVEAQDREVIYWRTLLKLGKNERGLDELSFSIRNKPGNDIRRKYFRLLFKRNVALTEDLPGQFEELINSPGQNHHGRWLYLLEYARTLLAIGDKEKAKNIINAACDEDKRYSQITPCLFYRDLLSGNFCEDRVWLWRKSIESMTGQSCASDAEIIVIFQLLMNRFRKHSEYGNIIQAAIHSRMISPNEGTSLTGTFHFNDERANPDSSTCVAPQAHHVDFVGIAIFKEELRLAGESVV